MASRADPHHRPLPVFGRQRAASARRYDERARSAALLPPARNETVEDLGYQFHNKRLVSIENGRAFNFNVNSDQSLNQQRYNRIGKCVERYVYKLLEDECGLAKYPIPLSAARNEPTGFIFASSDFQRAEFLMIIIHGTGTVRAGQWSRSLIINHGLDEGSQINYIKKAMQENYAVIVTNTNLNTDESSLHPGGRIRGSSSPEEHASYVWQNFVMKNHRAHICIVAHSYGGAVVTHLAETFTSDFRRRVFAIALTDSPMQSYTKNTDKTVLKVLQPITVNWVADKSPTNTDLKKTRSYGNLRSAGHLEHAWTSYTSFSAIFDYLDEKRIVTLFPRHQERK